MYVAKKMYLLSYLVVQSRFRVIYICACVCRGPKSVGGITWAKRAHAQSQYCIILYVIVITWAEDIKVENSPCPRATPSD